MSVHEENVEQIAGKEAKQKGYVSERGPFKIWANPKLNPPASADDVDVSKVADGFEYGALAEKFGEEDTRQKIGEMVKSFVPGASTTSLFGQGGKNGMSLVHVWFGPNFPLFRHSHPAYGDCLYYVVAGELLLGKRRLGPGSGFFVPNGMPYTYTAGPAGVEVLEFRAGGGEEGAPGMKLDELSLDSMQRIIDTSDELSDTWVVPENFGDTTLRQAEIDAAEK